MARYNGPRFGLDRKAPPCRCPDCSAKLAQPIYDYLPTYSRYDRNNHQRWHIRCDCGVLLLWSFPAEWIRRHLFPLWDLPKKRVVVS